MSLNVVNLTFGMVVLCLSWQHQLNILHVYTLIFLIIFFFFGGGVVCVTLSLVHVVAMSASW